MGAATVHLNHPARTQACSAALNHALQRSQLLNCYFVTLHKREQSQGGQDPCWGGRLAEPRATLLTPVLGTMALKGPVPCWDRGEDADPQVSPLREAQVTGTRAHSPCSEAVLAAQPDRKALGIATHLHGLHNWPEGLAVGLS